MRIWVLLFCATQGMCAEPKPCRCIGTYTTEEHAAEALAELCGDHQACLSEYDISELDVSGVHVDGCDEHEP